MTGSSKVALLLLAGNLAAVFAGRTNSDNSGVCPANAPLTQTEVCGCSNLRRKKCSKMKGASLALKNPPRSCVKDEDVTVELQLSVHTDSTTLYDLSMWVPTSFGSNYDRPFRNSKCSVTVFPCEDGGDGDFCGDLIGRSEGYGKFHSGCATYDPVEITIPCRSDEDGHLAVPVCLSWDYDAKATCSNIYDAPRNNCGCDVVSFSEVMVTVGATDDDDSTTDDGLDNDYDVVGECKPNGDDCDGIYDPTCCSVCAEDIFDSERYVCTDGGASGDPHLVGFRGQKFDFTGADGGYYALLAQEDPPSLVTMLVQAPVPGLDVITYIIGFGAKTVDLNGEVHTVQAFVKNSKDFYAHHQCPDEDEPCLAEGALTVLLDGEVVTRPGMYELGPGFEVGAVNLPGECRSFGFEKYWARKVREANEAAALASGAGDGRRLESWAVPMGEWTLGDSKVTNREECEDYVARAVNEDSLFHFQSEYVSFQITTPALTLRVNHGKLHQLAMRDPTDQFDLPDHRTFQQNMAFERAVLGTHPGGILGETARPTRDALGRPITHGIEAMRGVEEDYRVSGPFMEDFAMGLEERPGVVEAAGKVVAKH